MPAGATMYPSIEPKLPEVRRISPPATRAAAREWSVSTNEGYIGRPPAAGATAPGHRFTNDEVEDLASTMENPRALTCDD